MAYKVIILYRLYMPSYVLGTFTEYPYLAFSFYRRCSQIVPNHPYVFRQRWGIYFMPSITFSIESGFSIIRNTESESNPIYSI